MPIFTSEGPGHKDRWLVDGVPEFSVFPGGVIDQIPESIPIWLRVGNLAYGANHIAHKHGHWVTKTRRSVPQLVYEKLGQPGQIYNTEGAKKLKVSLRLNPSSLLILELIERGEIHFSVTSLYAHPSYLDGIVLGRYPGRR